MSNLNFIEKPIMHFDDSQKLNPEDMVHLQGGLCNKTAFYINGTCVCLDNCFLRVRSDSGDTEQGSGSNTTDPNQP